jgi:hypothetical protein
MELFKGVASRNGYFFVGQEDFTGTFCVRCYFSKFWLAYFCDI